MSSTPTRLYGASYVAAYLGVSLTTVHNWLKNPREDFPEPDVLITGLSGKNSAFGWSPFRLPEMRSWVTLHAKMDEAEAANHWAEIDNSLIANHPQASHHHQAPADAQLGQIPGQISFKIPAQRAPHASGAEGAEAA